MSSLAASSNSPSLGGGLNPSVPAWWVELTKPRTHSSQSEPSSWADGSVPVSPGRRVRPARPGKPWRVEPPVPGTPRTRAVLNPSCHSSMSVTSLSVISAFNGSLSQTFFWITFFLLFQPAMVCYLNFLLIVTWPYDLLWSVTQTTPICNPDHFDL
jgi:hypothetical protein